MAGTRYRKKNRNWKVYSNEGEEKRSKKPFLIGAAVVLILLGGIAVSPVFAVKEIGSEGAKHFTTSELSETIGLSEGSNCLLFGAHRAEKKLEENPYILEADIKRKLPDTVQICIKERQIRGYVPYMGTYLYIDKNGLVLDAQDVIDCPAPVVKGLVFDHFQKGEHIPVENKEALNVMLRAAQIMQKYELLDLVMELDVSDPDDVYAQVNQVKVHLGDMEHIDQKIRCMAEIVKNLSKEDRGTLELGDISKPMVFTYLT